MFLFCLWSIEQKKHVAFEIEAEEGESTDYEPKVTEVDISNKEDGFKKVFIVKPPHAALQNYDSWDCR